MLSSDSYFSEHRAQSCLSAVRSSFRISSRFHARPRQHGLIDSGSFTGAREESPRAAALSCKLYFSSLVSFNHLDNEIDITWVVALKSK